MCTPPQYRLQRLVHIWIYVECVLCVQCLSVVETPHPAQTASVRCVVALLRRALQYQARHVRGNPSKIIHSIKCVLCATVGGHERRWRRRRSRGHVLAVVVVVVAAEVHVVHFAMMGTCIIRFGVE